VKAHLKLDTALRFIGTNERGHETVFDVGTASGGLNSAASPVEIVLESIAACTSMDVVGILRKQRNAITEFSVDLTAERAETHPKVFTKVHMDFRLVSPDAQLTELVRAIELSHDTYCSVSAMIARSGCPITWQATLRNPETGEESIAASS